MSFERTIVICDSCKGSGKTISERYGWGWDEVCPRCDGHGRLLKVVGISYRKLSEEDLKLIPKPEGAI
jgi:hypothetical protein